MLSHKQLPLWNPYTFSGTPFLADINFGLLSPFNLFYLFFTPLRALTLSIISAVLLAGVSSYWFGRSLKLSRFSSLIASVVFMFSGSLMTHTMNTAILNTVVWLPLILTSIKHLIKVKKIKYALITSMFLALSLFGGHIQYFYYIILFSFCYIISQSISIREKIKYLCYVFIPVLFLTAVQLLPFLEYAGFSTRPPQDMGYAHGSTSLFSYIHLLLPNFFGVMKDGTSWGATADINGFVGTVPLLLAILIMVHDRSRRVFFFIIAAVVSLLLAFGKYSPLYLIAFRLLPFFSRFRSPASVLIIYTLCLSILAGYGTVCLFDKIRQKNYDRPFLSPVAFISVVILLLFSLYARFRLFSQFVTLIGGVNAVRKTAFLTRFLEYSHTRMQIIFHLWTENFILLLLFLALFILFILLIKKQRCITFVQKFILILLIVSELFIFGSNNYIAANESDLQTPKEIVDFFRRDNIHFRVLTMIDPGAKPPFADASYFSNEAIKAMALLQANTNMLHSVEIVGGYASIVHKDYADYISYQKSSDPTGITLPYPGMKQLDELGVKYIITAGRYEKELQASKQYELVLEYHDRRIRRTYHIYRSLSNFPKAYILNNGNKKIGSVNIISYQPNEVRLEVNSPMKGSLILADMYYPGWTAKVNNNPVSIARYKVFRSVPIEKGNNEVIFSYLPISFLVGATLSIANWLLALCFLGFVLIKEHQHVSKPLHIGKAKIKNESR